MKITLLLITVLSTGIFSGCGSSQTSSNTKSETTVAPVDITAFITEFVSNKIAAQDKYKDTYVQLTGIVSGKGTEHDDSSGGDFGAFVVIDPIKGSNGTNVKCHLGGEPEAIADAAVARGGEKITVKGQVEDMQNTSVQLKNCSVVA